MTNLIRNGSGEKLWPILSPFVQRALPQINLSASKLLSIVDTQSTAWFFRFYFQRFFRSFWGIFGWSEVNLLGSKPYRVLVSFSLISAIGLILSLFQRSFIVSKKVTSFLIIITLGQFILVTSRGIGTWFGRLTIPLARYFYPAIIPVAILFAWGFNEVFTFINRKTNLKPIILSISYSISLIAITAWAVISILTHY